MRVLLAVSSLSSQYAGQPKCFVANISSQTKARIQELAAIAKESGAGVFQEFGIQGKWLSSKARMIDLHRPMAFGPHCPFEPSRLDIRVQALRVDEDSFSFTAAPSHAEDTISLYTARIPLEKLSSKAIYADLG